MLRPDAPPATSPRRNAAATQQRLLDAAEHEFAMRGFAGARLRDIAAGAGVQPALIHHYFADKQGLYRAVLDRLLGQTTDDSFRVLGSRRDLAGLVAGFVDVLADFYATHRNFLAILRHESLDPSSISFEVIRARSLPVVDAVKAILIEKQRAGEVRADIDAIAIISAAMSLVAHPFTEASMMQALLPGSVPDDDASRARWKRGIVALILRGVAPSS